jgi:hypothetical protein
MLFRRRYFAIDFHIAFHFFFDDYHFLFILILPQLFFRFLSLLICRIIDVSAEPFHFSPRFHSLADYCRQLRYAVADDISFGHAAIVASCRYCRFRFSLRHCSWLGCRHADRHAIVSLMPLLILAIDADIEAAMLTLSAADYFQLSIRHFDFIAAISTY